MGRTLEALKHGEGYRLAARDKPFFEDSLEREPHAETAPIEEGNVPFIEVGPNKKVDGSPQVLAVKPVAPAKPAGPAAPATPVEKQASAIPAAVGLASPLGVAFEPWPYAPRLVQSIAEDIIAYHQPDHPISQQYAGLVDRMQDALTPAQAHVVLLTGSRSQVGTSTVLLNLVVAGARHGKRRVLALDLNLRRPCLAQRLGCPGNSGLQDVLQGKLALEQAVVPTAVANLHLVPAQPSAASIAYTADALRWLLSWLRERFDLIMVDGPAVDSPELAILAPLCDGVFLVLPQSESPPLQGTLAQTVTGMGARLRGLVHTHCAA